MKKRIFSVLLATLLFCSIVPYATAASGEGAAETLYALGLFKGTGTNADGTPIFDVDKTPTRNQALIMLVRLLGKEDEALAGTWEIPFTDVSESMRPYVGYAYNNGLTNGTSATTYSGSKPINSTQYIVFVLRALGYEDGVDFQWSNAWQFASDIRLNREDYTGSSQLTRGDLAIISEGALVTKLKASEIRLVEQICDKPIDKELPVTPKSFCFLFPYSQRSGDICMTGSTHGHPETDRYYTLIVNGSIIRDGYTVTCPAPDFCDIELQEDGRFRVETLRPGLEKIQVTYEGVTAEFEFWSWAPLDRL